MLHSSDSFSTFVLHRDGLAIALTSRKTPVRVFPRSGESWPEGIGACRLWREGDRYVGEWHACEEPWGGSWIESLKDAWEKAHVPYAFERRAANLPFVALDVESDGAELWEVAFVSSDGDGHIGNTTVRDLKGIQEAVDRLLPGRTLVGHNLRGWDKNVLARQGVLFPADIDIWDTLEQEVELCAKRQRPSFALRTAHRAEADARNAIALARNQWLRKNAPAELSELAERAWAESDQFFIVPTPQWASLVPRLETAKLSWAALEEAYPAIDPAVAARAIADVEWGVVPPPVGEDAPLPFNPASPKRVDYWHRLLPAVAAARSQGPAAILLAQHEHEMPMLTCVIEGAFTGDDARRGVRTLAKRGGLLILPARQWSRTLAEGLPPNSVVILERMPETLAASGDPDLADWTSVPQDKSMPDDRDRADGNDAEGDAGEDDEDGEDGEHAAALSYLPPLAQKKPLPDLYALGKMALWCDEGTSLQLACLDARLWDRRTLAPFRIKKLACDWHRRIERERLESAGFRNTTEEFRLPDQWEREICDWFGSAKLYDFQRERLSKILPRDGFDFEYVERATGGGKSLVFQAAALYRGAQTGRLTVVVSPLRALIHDQVSQLHDKGFALDVEALSGDMNRADVEDAYRRIAGGETKLVYTAPERFRSKGFRRALETRLSLDAGGEPEYWVFDEAHCISLWGLEFRPDYRKAAAYIRQFRGEAENGGGPVLLVSATLTALAKQDIERVLGFRP